jgi:hypothetical protein
MTTVSMVKWGHYLRLKMPGLQKCLPLVAVLVLLGVPVLTQAATPISEGYTTSEKLGVGNIVSLEKNSSDRVVAANIKNASNILGVVVGDTGSPITLATIDGEEVQVATNGIVRVVASDINGDIYQGDNVTSSPIAGVGMKATNNVKVVGIAQGTLTNDTKQSYTDKQGKKQTIRIGDVPVLLNVSYFYKQPEKTVIPSAIQNVANSLAGKNANPLPIIISAAIFIITLIVVSSMIYSMIRSSIISVGRNPMAQSAVYRDLIQMSLLVVVILGVALVSIFLVLRKF